MFDSLFDCRLEKYIFKVKYVTFYIGLVQLFHYSLQVFGIQMKSWTVTLATWGSWCDISSMRIMMSKENWKEGETICGIEEIWTFCVQRYSRKQQ